MRLYKTPDWINPITCKCGGEVVLQPYDHFLSDHDIDSRVGCRNAIVGLNFICNKCFKQFVNYQSDWGYVKDDLEFEELYQKKILNRRI